MAQVSAVVHCQYASFVKSGILLSHLMGYAFSSFGNAYNDMTYGLEVLDSLFNGLFSLEQSVYTRFGIDLDLPLI
jgi:hypothetical protein